jgi:hypothetical protein
MGMNKEIWADIQTRQKFSARVRRSVCRFQILSDKADLSGFDELSLQLNQFSEDIKVLRDYSDLEICSLQEKLYS